MGNKDTPDDIFKGRGNRLPNSPFGLNPYQHLHHAVILSALNPPPAHFSFLDALGFNSREVKRAGYWQSCYQAAMRISLRNPDDSNPKTVIVMDRATAEWMSSMFPGCAVAPLGGMSDMPIKGKPGRTRTHECDADRKRANRNQFKAELGMALDLIAGGERAARHCSPAVAELREPDVRVRIWQGHHSQRDGSSRSRCNRWHHLLQHLQRRAVGPLSVR